MSTPTTPSNSDKLLHEKKSLTPKWKKDALLSDFNRNTNVKEKKRRLILDEDKFEETFLKCMICQEVYDRIVRVPKVLPCHHDVCLVCLQEMFRVESEHRSNITSAYRDHGPSAVKITCPACRDTVIKSVTEISSLPSDVTALELIDFVRTSEKCVVSYCRTHANVPMNFYCETCQMQICAECTSHEYHRDHEIIDAEIVKQESEPDVNDTLQLVISETSNLVDVRKTLETAVSKLDDVSEQMEHDITAAFEDVTQKRPQSKRAGSLIQVTRREIDRKRDYLVQHLEIVREHEAALNASRTLLQEARSSGDLDEILMHHKLVKDTLSKELPSAISDKEELNSLMSFTVDDDIEIYEEVRDLKGNVISRR